MAKRGGTKHLKRIAAPKAIPITNKKENTWMLNTNPGPHPKKHAITIRVLLRDVMSLAQSSAEVRQLLSGRMVEIDGRPRAEEKFPVGLMDVVSFPKAQKYYRLVVDYKGRLMLHEITKDAAATKIAKVVRKQTIPGGKLNITFHDGKTIFSDNHIKVGDSVVLSLPKNELTTHLKLEKGARCLVSEGKHAGAIVHLKELIARQAGKSTEARVEGVDKTEFITVAKYLFVVDGHFRVK